MRLLASEAFEAYGIINLDGRASGGERLERADEIARRWHREMRQQGGAIGPLFHEHQPQRILAIDMHGVRDASGLATRAMHVLETQSASFTEAIFPDRHAARYHDHRVPPRRLPLSSYNCVASTGKFHRLLRPAFQRGAAGIGQHIDAPLGAIEPAVDV